MFTLSFWRDAGERAIRTFAQVAVTMLAASQGGLLHVAWTGTLSVAGLAALVSVLNSLIAPPTQSAPVAGSAPAPIQPAPPVVATPPAAPDVVPPA